MNLDTLLKQSDAYTDEALSKANALIYANKALAVINAKLGTELPYFADTITVYIALTETWQRQLLIPYLNYSIKMNDSSLNEASRYESEFYTNLSEFEEVYSQILAAPYLVNVKGSIFQGSARQPNRGWFRN